MKYETHGRKTRTRLSRVVVSPDDGLHQYPSTFTLSTHDTRLNEIHIMTDRQTPFSISLFGSQAGDGPQDAAAPSRVQQALVDFIMEFTLDNVFVYRYGVSP